MTPLVAQCIRFACQVQRAAGFSPASLSDRPRLAAQHTGGDQPADGEYEVLSPEREIIIIDDPIMTGTRRSFSRRMFGWIAKLKVW
jgi:hypothetical protein